MMRTYGNYVIIFIMGLWLLLLGGCEEEYVSEIVNKKDGYVMEHYTRGEDTYTDTEYEMIVNTIKSHGIDVSIGPHEPRYKGVITLTQDKAEELLNAYEWEKTDKQEITFDKVEFSDTEHGEWYCSKAFEKDYFKLVNVNQAYFDGKNTILYDIQTR